MQEQEYVGYSFESDETFEWSTRHKVMVIKNALAQLKEECMSEAQIVDNQNARELLETAAYVLEGLEHSFDRDFQYEGVEYSSKSDEPWD